MYRKVVIYEGERALGEVGLHQSNGVVLVEELKEIRIIHYTSPSERCSPLAVLRTICSTGICFKLESAANNLRLSDLHNTCLRDNKTAVAFIGDREIHLVAMHSKKYEKGTPCFWGFDVASSLYNSCLVMLNLRCLGIVFDLDETLIVANTMRSFEDKIEALQSKLDSESDPQRISGMQAEVKRYQEDKHILKQYTESDQVINNGKIIKSQSEVVLALSDNHKTVVRPLIRLQDKNIILTRINPLIRDTSVLVRLRPGWEDLRSYLTARGRKRFEVFVCTMGERNYALEMWRLLDPESNLINSRELLDRIVCVKSSCRKSLLNVFKDGSCHPKMSLVIDDRLNVWDEKDQPRVHVVPPFSPYHAPHVEGNNTVPVLHIARNVVCDVRGRFFKEFDDGLLKRISEVAYVNDIKDIPSLSDVSKFLISEDDPSDFTINKDSPPPSVTNLGPRVVPSSFTVPPPTIQGPVQQLPQVATPLQSQLAHLEQAEKLLHDSVAEEGEIPESELDPDTRRRLLILQHGQDMRELPPSESQFTAHPPVQVSAPVVQPHGWFPAHGEMSQGQLNRIVPSNEFSYDPCAEMSTIVLQDIAFKCGTKVEFKQTMLSNTELPFFVEVFFPGEKIGEGIGRTKIDARRLAAERSLLYLADKYSSKPPSYIPADGSRFAYPKDNGFISDVNSLGYQLVPKEDTIPFSTASKSMPAQFRCRRQDSLRSMQGISNKRLKSEVSRVQQQMPQSNR